MGSCRSSSLYLRLRRVGGGGRGRHLDRRHRGAGRRGLEAILLLWSLSWRFQVQVDFLVVEILLI